MNIKFKKNERVMYFSKNGYYEEAMIEVVHPDNTGVYYTVKLGETRFIEKEPHFESYKELQTTEDKLISSSDWNKYYKSSMISQLIWSKHYFHLNW